MTKVHLADAVPIITEALSRLMQKPESERHYVCVIDPVTQWFVQFAQVVGSRGERLCFDVPQLGISERPDDALSDVAARACAVLRNSLNVSSEALLVIEEGEQRAVPS